MSEASPYQPPTTSDFSGGGPKQPAAKPIWVTIVAVFGIVMGILGVLGGLCGFLAALFQQAMMEMFANLPQDPNGPDLGEIMERSNEAVKGLLPIQYVVNGLSLIVSGMLLWFSITTLNKVRSGRGMLSISFWGMVFVNIVGIGVACYSHVLVGEALADMEGMVGAPSTMVNIISTIVFSLPFAAAYVASAIYLSTSSVKNWFEQHGQ